MSQRVALPHHVPPAESSRRHHRRLGLAAVTGLFLILAAVRVSYSLKGLGLIEEWDLYSVIESGVNLLAYTHQVFTTRPLLMLAYVVSYHLTPGSFVGLNYLLLMFVLLKAVCFYRLLRRLIPDQPLIAFLSAALLLVYPADTGLMQLRTFSVHFAVFTLILAALFMLSYWDRPSRSRLCWMWAALGLSLATYEVGYALALFVPLILVWLNRGLGRRVIRVSGLWYVALAAAAVIALLAQHTVPDSYITTLAQNTAMSMDFGSNIKSMFDNTLRMYARNFYEGWRDAFSQLLTNAAYLTYGLAVMLVVTFIGWLHRGRGKALDAAPQGSYRRYGLLLLAVFMGVGIGFSPYLLSITHRVINDRVYYYASMFSAIAVVFTFYLISRRFALRPLIYIALIAVFAGAGTLNLINDIQIEIDYTKIQNRLLGGIVEAVPSVKTGTLLLVIDDTRLMNSLWLFEQSYRLNLALRVLYNDQSIYARICYPDGTVWGEMQESCQFTDQGVTLNIVTMPPTTQPYSKMVLLEFDKLQQVHLLHQIPSQYLANPHGTQGYAPEQLVNITAPLPPRVHTLLLQWPVEPLASPPSQH